MHGFKQFFFGGGGGGEVGGRGGRGKGEAIQGACGMVYRNPDLRVSKNVC